MSERLPTRRMSPVSKFVRHSGQTPKLAYLGKEKIGMKDERD